MGTWIFMFVFSRNVIEPQWWLAGPVRDLAGIVFLRGLFVTGRTLGPNSLKGKRE